MTNTQSEIFAKHGNDRLVEFLLRYQVSFLVIGGTAVAVHGCRDRIEVDDFDFMIEPSIDNAKRVLHALAAAQINLQLDARQLARRGNKLGLKTMEYYAEMLTPMRGVEFSVLLERSVEAKLGMHTVAVIGRKDLIEMKEMAVEAISKDLEKHRRDLACLAST